MPDDKDTTRKSDAQPEVSRKIPEETLSQTHHTVEIGGQTIAYTATAGTMILREESEDGEKPKVTIFFVAYTRDGVEDLGRRPLTFSFNGGPGSSSVWLHMGLLGPRRVQVEDDGAAEGGQARVLPPPYQLIDNAHSLLDVSDLVFIDPVSTGYSRSVPGEKAEDYHGFEKDIASVGEFIRLYTTRYQRWLSPKFLIGESYGTTRAAGLSGFLQDRHGLYLNGVMLVSSILNFITTNFDPGNDLPFALFLPTYAATAWYHRRLPEPLQADLLRTLEEVEAFALGDYSAALLRGDLLAGSQRQRVARRLARYTGLPERYVEQTNLRINIYRFVKELLRDRRRTVGRLDSRYTGIDRDAAGERFEYDPSYAAIQGPYTAALNDHLRTRLDFESDLPYEILTGLYEKWDYRPHQNRYVNVAETLRDAMSKNPHLKVFVANGYYDFATPYFATRYTFDHLGLDPSLHQNITMSYYQAGHMMYIHRPSLVQLKEDLARFVEGAAN